MRLGDQLPHEHPLLRPCWPKRQYTQVVDATPHVWRLEAMKGGAGAYCVYRCEHCDSFHVGGVNTRSRKWHERKRLRK